MLMFQGLWRKISFFSNLATRLDYKGVPVLSQIRRTVIAAQNVLHFVRQAVATATAAK